MQKPSTAPPPLDEGCNQDLSGLGGQADFPGQPGHPQESTVELRQTVGLRPVAGRSAIFGCVTRSRADLSQLGRLSAALQNRGRGTTDAFTLDNVVVGVRGEPGSNNTRVFSSDDGRIQAVLDGAIYNSVSLREDLAARGYQFHTERDGELLVHLYDVFGTSCFERLRGAFAAAIWDKREQQLVVARDHIGHKPVFYSEKDNGLYFASESKALLTAGVTDFVLDPEALTHFLSFRFLPAPFTLVKAIRKLPPAHVLIRRNHQTQVRRYWSPSFANKSAMTIDEAIDGLEEKLHETIAAYLTKHRSSGSFLSAGLDSGLIVANMADILREPFHTFTLGVANDSDEAPVARLVSTKFATIPHEAYPSDEFVQRLPDMIWHLGEPSDMVVVSKYLGAALAAPYVPVALSGDGGDELFAGFPRYLGVRDAQILSYLPNMVRSRMISAVARHMGGSRSLSTLPGKLHWISYVAGAGQLPERYAAAVEYLRFCAADKRRLFTDSAWREVSGVNSAAILTDVLRASDAEDPIEKMLHVDYLTRLPEHLLMLADRTSSAHGIDMPCPLADKDLVEFVATIPANMKTRGRTGKYLEMRLAERTLPPEVINFRKTGWSFPFDQLCAGSLRSFLQVLFRDSRLAEDGIFSASYMESLVVEHANGTADHHVRIWMLLSLEIWYRMTRDELDQEKLRDWMDNQLAVSRAN